MPFKLQHGIYLLPFLVAYICWSTFPFSDTLSSKTISLSQLSSKQKANIEIAAQRVNGNIIKPNSTFSFNQIVGPRTVERGYKTAPSYLEGESQSTLGGGICLLSSALYQLALETNCQIIERVAHQRTIRSVPAGLDATVWYGKADLRFTNTSSQPIQIITEYRNNNIKIAFMSDKSARKKPIIYLEPITIRKTNNYILVDVIGKAGKQLTLISHDLYKVN
jgi:vancomycin resistance protein YoaR